MTSDLALAYIAKRVCELGCERDYTIRVRHLVLQPAEQRKLNAHNQLFILLEPYCDMRIESDTGVFDVSEDRSNELQYEHRGDITITNQSIFTKPVRFVQVILKKCKKPCE